MKKIIILLVLIFCFIPQMWSQNVYYYYNGNKEPLNENQTKFVSILPKTENVTLPASSGLMLTDTISDEYSFIRIYEADSSESINESITTSLVTLQPCYKTEEGFDLIPNGYINVKLKSDSDYSLLQSISEENGCIIVEQNPFMPLWYNLRVNADVEQNSVEIAPCNTSPEGSRRPFHSVFQSMHWKYRMTRMYMSNGDCIILNTRDLMYL